MRLDIGIIFYRTLIISYLIANIISRFPVILSVENHLGSQMQEDFARMIKDILGGRSS